MATLEHNSSQVATAGTQAVQDLVVLNLASIADSRGCSTDKRAILRWPDSKFDPKKVTRAADRRQQPLDHYYGCANFLYFILLAELVPFFFAS